MDFKKIKAAFPIFQNQKMVYLDSAASAQKPKIVLQAEQDFYTHSYANVHRGLYPVAQAATQCYEDARHKVQQFLNAKETEEIIFTKGATEAINLVAFSFGSNLKKGDEVIVTVAEHHANFLPWKMLAEKKGILLHILPVSKEGDFLFDAFEKKISSKTKLVAVTGASNVLGVFFPLKEIIQAAHQKGAKVLVDGAVHVVHQAVDVQDLDCDFYAFSSHKIYGPTGVGVLYAKKDLLEQMPPYQTGGEMIALVTEENVKWAKVPYKFEAGTPPIAQAVGLGAALDFISNIGWDKIQEHENRLLTSILSALQKIKGIKIYGPQEHLENKAPLISFTLENASVYDVATLLTEQGICLRSGFHCAEPLHHFIGADQGSLRISFGMYNTPDDVDAFIIALEKTKKILNLS